VTLFYSNGFGANTQLLSLKRNPPNTFWALWFSAYQSLAHQKHLVLKVMGLQTMTFGGFKSRIWIHSKKKIPKVIGVQK